MNLYAKKARLQTVISEQMFTKLSFFLPFRVPVNIKPKPVIYSFFFVTALFEITNYGKKEKKREKKKKSTKRRRKNKHERK